MSSDNIMGNLPEKSAFLLIGPPHSGEKRVLYSFIQEVLPDEPVLFITTDRSPEEMKKDMMAEKVFVTKHESAGILRYIDCYSRQTDEKVRDTESVRRVSGPLALNEVSIALSEIEKEFLKRSEHHNVIFNSLSTVLMYSNPQMVGRFLQVVVAKIKRAGGRAIFLMEEGMHDDKVIVTVEHLMDGIIHVKKDGDRVSVRADGISGAEKWTGL